MACLLIGTSLIVQAVAGVASRNGQQGAEVAYWLSFGLLVVSALVVQLLLEPSPAERTFLVIVTGLGLYMIKVLSYPTSFTYFDELSHYRTVVDLLHYGRLFHGNPALVVSPFYPGLELVTASLARLTGLSVTTCGLLLIGIGRVVLAAALYALFSEIGRSRKVGGVAAVLYMANPSFLYFDSDFSYESFALPLAAVALLLTLKWMRASTGRSRRSALLGATVAVGAVVTTHHTTSYLLALFLVVLCVCAVIATRYGGTERIPWQITVVSIVLTGAWLAVVAPSTAKYLGQVFGPAIDGAAQVLFAGQAARAPFSGGSSAGASPLWLQGMGFASVLIVVASLPLSLALVWRRRSEAAVLACGAIALAYIPVQALRLSGAGVESANRSSEFVFVGAAFSLALCFAHLLDSETPPFTIAVRGKRLLGRRKLSSYLGRSWLGGWLTVLGAVSFIGGVVALWPPYGRLPGPYIAGADIRSITSEGAAAARWLEATYGPGQRVLTDRSDAQSVAAYGEATPVERDVGPVSVARVFISSTFDDVDRGILRADRVSFVMVDTRLSTELPARGFYFTPNEIGGGVWTQPVPLPALTKFATAPGISLVYDNGPIQIYDVRSVSRS